MVLGLDTDPTLGNLVTGLGIVVSLALTVEVARLLENEKKLNPSSRFLLYTGAALTLTIVWILAFSGTSLGAYFTVNGNGYKYFPTSEVNTAVIPALHHWWMFPWQAPYGVVWYAVNSFLLGVGDLYYFMFSTVTMGIVPVPVPEAYLWMLMLALWNIPFLYLFRKSELLTAYLMTSLFLWFVIPWDLSILWIVCLGFLGRGFLPRIGAVLLAVTAKIPVGAPLAIWRYDFLAGNDGTGSAFVPGHWMPYFVLGAWSLAVLLKPYISFLSLDSFYGLPGQLQGWKADPVQQIISDGKEGKERLEAHEGS